MDEQTSIKVCGLISGILSSDQEMDVHEAGFLQRMRKRFGVAKGAPVPPIVDLDDAVAKLQELPERVRYETLELLIQAAAADGKISSAERSFLGAIAGKLRVDAADIEARLQHELEKRRPQPFGPAATSDDDG